MKINWKSIAISSAAAIVLGAVVTWAAQTNYLGTVFIADPSILTRQMAVNVDGSINATVVSGGGITQLTGDVTAGPGAGSQVATLATVNANVGSFGSATKASTITVDGKGRLTAAGETTVTPAVGSVTGLGTGVATTLGVNIGTAGAPVVNGGALGTPSSGVGTNLTGTAAGLTAGTANAVASNLNLPGSPTTTTQTAGDNTTKVATTAFTTTAINNAIAGVNPAVAVQAATTAAGDTSGLTYNNGVGGIGATFTGSVNTALTVDGYTFTTAGQRLLVKNDTQSPSGAFNGVFYVTQVQTGILPPILTRALDYDTPSDINNTGAIPVVNGTVNALTSWLLTSSVATVGTDPLTYAQFSYSPTRIQPLAVGGTGADLSGTGGTGQVVKQNSSGGVLTVGLPQIGVPSCCQSTTRVSHTGDTSEFVLATIAVPTLIAGASVEVTPMYSFIGTAGIKTIKIYYGATGSGVGGTLYASIATAASALNGKTIFNIWNRTTSSQFGGGSAGVGNGTTAMATSAVNTTVATELTITGTLANSADTVAIEGYTTKVIIPATWLLKRDLDPAANDNTPMWLNAAA